MLGFSALSTLPLGVVPPMLGPYVRPAAASADLQFEGAYTAPSATAADLSFVSGNPASSLGPTALFGSPVAAYARTQGATGAAPSTTFGTARFGTTVAATVIAPNTKLGAPPKFGPNILQIVGNGADGETTFFDTSPYYATLTRNGSIAKSTAQSRFGTGSISLTGASTANNITSPSDKRFNLVGDLFTIEAEVYLNAYNASGGRLLSSGAGANGWNVTNGFQWLLQSNGTGIQFDWLWYGFSGGFWGYYAQSLPVALSLSTWAQVKVTFDGTTVRLFLDGVLVGSSAKPPIIYGGSTTVAAAVAVGALVGEATGATYAANAYIQQIRIRTDCTDVAAFSAPTAGLPSWIGELAGIAPTAQIPTPRVRLDLPVTGFQPTVFGTGFGQSLQRPTGFQTGAVGDPRIFPFSPPPIYSTQFGTGRLFPYHVAPGIHSTQFGPINGWQHWDEVWNPPATKFGTPTTPTNRTAQAAGFQSTRYGQPSKVSHKQDGESWLCIASGFDPVRISSPVATWPQSGSVSGIAAGHLGTPKGARGQRATGIHSTVIGAPTVKTMLKAYGFASSHLGLAVAVMTQRAAGARFSQRFGIPESDIGNTHKVYGINASGRIGNPSGFSRFNYLVTGFRPVAIGSASCHESHRVSHVTPICRLGTPTLKRNTQC